MTIEATVFARSKMPYCETSELLICWPFLFRFPTTSMNISGLDENDREFFAKAASMASFEFKIKTYLIQEIKTGLQMNAFIDNE